MISLVLGVVVVLFAGLFAYNYFRAHREIVPNTNTTVAQIQSDKNEVDNSQNAKGTIDQGVSAVALPVSHTVAEGENLWTIAEKYYKSGFNYLDIASVNKLADPGQIEAGQKLTIPKVNVRQPVTVAGASAPEITTSRIEGKSYTVLKGDSLWEIAVRAYGDGFQYVKIVKVNNLVYPDLIHSGNVLTIPR